MYVFVQSTVRNSLQCFDTVGEQQDGHPACKRTATTIPKSLLLAPA